MPNFQFRSWIGSHVVSADCLAYMIVAVSLPKTDTSNCLYNSESSVTSIFCLVCAMVSVLLPKNSKKRKCSFSHRQCLSFKRKLTNKLSSLIFFRSIFLTYERTVTVKNIKLYRFITPDKNYLSGDVYPPNKGFCVPPRCLPTGLLNVSLCKPMSKI